MQRVELRLPETVVKVHPSVEKQPIGKLRRTMGVSIKTASTPQPPAQEAHTQPLPLTDDTLRQYWDDMLQAMQDTLPKLAEQLRGRQLRIEDDENFAIEVNNSYLDAEIRPHLLRMLTYLRRRCGRPMLNCHVEVVYEQTEALAYTPRDKYDAMAQHNPTIEKLRELFPDVDY